MKPPFLALGVSLICVGVCPEVSATPSLDPTPVRSPLLIQGREAAGDGGVRFPRMATIAQVPPFQQVAQGIPPVQERPEQPLIPPRPDLQPLPVTPPAPPPKPQLETPVAPSPPPSPQAPEATVFVKRVEVLGSRAFSQADLRKVVQRYENKDLTFEQLLQIRTDVTRYYTDRGYATSGAFLPPQDLASGIVKIQVVEGQLEKIEVQGLSRLRESYVRKRLARSARPPLNIRNLETALQLLQLDPLFTSVRAELKAGTAPGRSVLSVNLREAPAFHGALAIENRDSPSVGSIRGSAVLSHNNLLGFGDRLSLEYGRTEGIRSYDAAYEIPLSASDTTLSLRYTQNTSRIVEPPFSILDINSASETFSIGLRQPFFRSPTNEFTLGLTLDIRKSQTFLLGDTPFSFSLGPENGESKVRVLRFSQDWISRSPRRVLAARSQFSFGLPIFGATINDTGTDGRFVSWVGQFQWVQSLGGDIISIARVAVQLTPDSLLPLEQFSIGGIDTVRGYRQNQRVGDNGISASLEVRVPIIRSQAIGVVSLAPFFDIGSIWNSSDVLITDPRTLMSTGIGLRWQWDPYVSARLDYGIRLNPIADQGNTLQDQGIYFSIRVQPF